METGQFGMGQDVSAVRDAMAARQQGGPPTPALSQVSGGAPSGPSPMAQGPAGPAPAMGAPAPMGASAMAPKSEAEIIVKALDQRLRAISKVEEAQSPKQAPVGGGYNGSARSSGGGYDQKQSDY